jgi:hypothetical protein
MVMACLSLRTDLFTKASGDTARYLARESLLGLMAGTIEESGSKISFTALANTPGQTENASQGSTRMTKNMARARWSGLMEGTIMETGSMANSMALDTSELETDKSEKEDGLKEKEWSGSKKND